jgi:hypothetical protein
MESDASVFAAGLGQTSYKMLERLGIDRGPASYRAGCALGAIGAEPVQIAQQVVAMQGGNR